jgi:hypothetical protein
LRTDHFRTFGSLYGQKKSKIEVTCNIANVDRSFIIILLLKKWAANQSILRGVKALAVELVLKSKENQIIMVGDL